MLFKSNKKQICFIFLLTLVSCKNWGETNSSFLLNNHKKEDTAKINILLKEVPKQAESIGSVCLREGYNGSKIILYNEDGSVWKSFIMTDNFEDKSIAPFALKSDDRLLVFQMYDSSDLFYVVKVDEKKNLFKFIKKADKNFIYEPWEKHILKVFSVDFDYKLNPPKEEPFDNSKTKPYDKEQFYHPVKVKDEWLMIKDDDDKESWIKWKDNKGTLVVTLYYSA
jgi:hypothetical protein